MTRRVAERAVAVDAENSVAQEERVEIVPPLAGIEPPRELDGAQHRAL